MNIVDLMVAIVERSSSYKCGHVAYEIDGEGLIIRDHREKGGEMFSSTDLCTDLNMFNLYFRVREGRIELRVF